MTSSRPYLVRAIYDWLLDNDMTPHLLVNTQDAEVFVPDDYDEDGQIVLNIEPNAVIEFEASNEAVSFKARFSGVSHDVYVPIRAIKAIYAFENGRGMVFEEDDEDGDDDGAPTPPLARQSQQSSPPAGNKKKSGRPHLKIVK